MTQYLSLYGGSKAISIIKENGLTQNIVKVVAGAAGGPKWMILSHMDRFLFTEWFKNRSEPLFLAGSSAGAWRFAALSQRDPGKALDLLLHSYIYIISQFLHLYIYIYITVLTNCIIVV